MIIISKIKATIIKIRTKLYLTSFSKTGKKISFDFPLTIKGKHNISIGNDTAIGTYCHIWGHGGINIGSNVLIAAHCCITSLGHDYTKPLIKNEVISKPVVIEDDVWLGYNVTVLPGVTIGKGSVIGAGSVVSKNIPQYSIAVGNPVRIIKNRVVDTTDNQ
jgi:maltose O-acetyltransferase